MGMLHPSTTHVEQSRESHGCITAIESGAAHSIAISQCPKRISAPVAMQHQLHNHKPCSISHKPGCVLQEPHLGRCLTRRLQRSAGRLQTRQWRTGAAAHRWQRRTCACTCLRWRGLRHRVNHLYLSREIAMFTRRRCSHPDASQQPAIADLAHGCTSRPLASTAERSLK